MSETSITAEAAGTERLGPLSRLREDVATVRRLVSERDEFPHDSYLGFVVIDVDGCRRLNTRLGREAGDEALRALAVRLDEEVRAMDTLVRWQSDEFVIVLRQLEITDLPDIVERFLVRARGELSLMGRTESRGRSQVRAYKPVRLPSSASALRAA